MSLQYGKKYQYQGKKKKIHYSSVFPIHTQRAAGEVKKKKKGFQLVGKRGVGVGFISPIAGSKQILINNITSTDLPAPQKARLRGAVLSSSCHYYYYYYYYYYYLGFRRYSRRR